MKARVKATGEIVDIAYTFKTVGKNPISKYETLKGKRYNEDDLDFNIEDDNTPDYWTRLEHTYAGMAMQGILSNQNIGADVAYMVNLSIECATALVEKLKEKEERK
jgi:hypothetical protein